MNAKRSSLQRFWTSLSTTLIVIVSAATCGCWPPQVRDMIDAAGAPANEKSDSHTGHQHARAGHAHPTHDDDSLELSAQGLKNVGFRPIRVELSSYVRKISIPAMIVERPGRSQMDVSAPLTGIVTRIHPIEGQAVSPGQTLFEVRLTHEELVVAQRDFLRFAEELDVVSAEVRRLKTIEGVIAGKRILEKQYEKQKIEAAMRAQRQGILLHGLNEKQVDNILTSRQLLHHLTVVAPPYTEVDQHDHFDHIYHVQHISANTGQHINAGDSLGRLADHCHLYIEGKAFEEDTEQLNTAATEGWKITAAMMSDGNTNQIVEDLKILYLADQVDPESRAFRFYISLPNEIVRDQTEQGTRFIGWRYKPGQRVVVRVPIEQLDNRIVLPVNAVVQDGVETYVFRQNGKRFDRVAVHVEASDSEWVVVANDGALASHNVVAATGAYQMHLALKNKSGVSLDAHGHSH